MVPTPLTPREKMNLVAVQRGGFGRCGAYFRIKRQSPSHYLFNTFKEIEMVIDNGIFVIKPRNYYYG
jgi:hypothetical protein